MGVAAGGGRALVRLIAVVAVVGGVAELVVAVAEVVAIVVGAVVELAAVGVGIGIVG